MSVPQLFPLTVSLKARKPGLWPIRNNFALPNWHWYAFEHVNNLGRCDFTGCNDSYGFKKTVSIPAPVQTDC